MSNSEHDASNKRQKNINTLINKLRKQLSESKTKHPLDTAVHLFKEEWSAVCGYEHSAEGRLEMTISSDVVTCPNCLEHLEKKKREVVSLNRQIDNLLETKKRQNPTIERIKQVQL